MARGLGYAHPDMGLMLDLQKIRYTYLLGKEKPGSLLTPCRDDWGHREVELSCTFAANQVYSLPLCHWMVLSHGASSTIGNNDRQAQEPEVFVQPPRWLQATCGADRKRTPAQPGRAWPGPSEGLGGYRPPGMAVPKKRRTVKPKNPRSSIARLLDGRKPFPKPTEGGTPGSAGKV
ncbi:Os07g0146083 [Oryza sativa Japonica Group]|uniref:Os07g0146083 protein n=1 Tax=Oryza sativa subsp. japonica TaxID=39947 RepID=A0A0N7KMX7_ORYSJ|nr:Os07g0146083 [Oryza sativa Japonica Group]